ncbi:MAG: DUF370 domain-containing protein [Lachnospiraceae bacterium]|jgi:regulator of extracellular matrix RemA (YlzA/DUF370 family)|nr:DUF370 domain-containing protein [Lachnospiraceae bacterium]MBQ2565509.1 DUF370 domain-containing protein [Oscillospiraceae bacterium]MBQ5870741.1 DUF370 domain-containing protein [Lachnospiraceae bacterium]
MLMTLLNIGFGNMVSAERIIAVVSPDSAPIKRIIQEVKEEGMLIDASFGRSTRSVLMMDNGNVVLSSLETETISERIAALNDESEEQ